MKTLWLYVKHLFKKTEKWKILTQEELSAGRSHKFMSTSRKNHSPSPDVWWDRLPRTQFTMDDVRVANKQIKRPNPKSDYYTFKYDGTKCISIPKLNNQNKEG